MKMPGVELGTDADDESSYKSVPKTNSKIDLKSALSWPVAAPDFKDANGGNETPKLPEDSLEDDDVGIVISLTKSQCLRKIEEINEKENCERSRSQSKCKEINGGSLDFEDETQKPAGRFRNGVRFYSEGTDLNDFAIKGNKKRHFSKPIVERWRKVVERALSMDDPWIIYRIEDLPTEECIRHHYSSIRKKWVSDTAYVKLQNESFARGAMRECFRLKKLSTLRGVEDWSQNYVAKSYISCETARDVYFEDVKLQMDAKLWAEEYNRHNPPKKVDIFQITILEFKDRPDRPLFHLEHYIDGEYIKYNSNSGFVSETSRQTPHAFSHFTFERSGHQLIVVDVQGVGDLYTDPQIHTVDGKEYGEGNLGTKGMALFFYTHRCNDICRSMGLTPFDLSPTEKAKQNKNFKQRGVSETVCRNSISICSMPSKQERTNIMEFLRQRTSSQSFGEYDSSSSSSSSTQDLSGDIIEEEIDGEDVDGIGGTVVPAKRNGYATVSDGSNDVFDIAPRLRRNRCDTELDSCSSISSSYSGLTQPAEREAYWEEMRRASRPAGLDQEFLMEKATRETLEAASLGGSILGQVHLDMARYHEMGRFMEEGEQYDRAAAWFHLECAAKCGVMEALLTAARIYLSLPHDLLQDFTVEQDESNEDQGLDWMEMAADFGDRGAMLFLAEAYEKGTPLGTERQRSYDSAVEWYQRAAVREEPGEDREECGEASLCIVETPRFQIYAKMAELYRFGGFQLPANPMKSGDLYHEAAEGAMEAMKGKLANQYYQLAEEAWAEVEEE